MVSLLVWSKFFPLVPFFSLDQIPKIKIFHMVGIEHPKVIRVVRHLIVADVIYPEEEDEDIAVDDYGSASDE